MEGSEHKKKKLKTGSQDLLGDKRKIHRSRQACTNCHKARARCDSQRPCSRCVRLGIADCCETFVGKKRGRKPVNERLSNPSSPSEGGSRKVAGKERNSLSPEERDNELENDNENEDQDQDYDECEPPECLSESSCCSSPVHHHNHNHQHQHDAPSNPVPVFSYPAVPVQPEEMMQKYMLAQDQHQYQPDHQYAEEQEQIEDQRLGFPSDSLNDQYQNDDALVPSLTPPQYKEFPSRQPPSIFLGVDESRSSKVFIRSTTRSFSDLLQFPHGQLDGMDFRDLMPRAMFRSCLLSCYQKVLENQETKQPVIVFTIPTILKTRTGVIPVELTFNVSGDFMESSVNRVDVRELSVQEALNHSLPIFNTDLDDPGIMNPLAFDDYLSFGVDQTC